MKTENDLRFAVDAPLGKLSKWLRILGFDVIYEPDAAWHDFSTALKQHRVLLTRSARIGDRMPPNKRVLIRSDKPVDQLKETIDALNLDLNDIRPFTRCIRCNLPIRDVEKQAVFGRVPDYIWQTRHRFKICPGCERIYWSGSHNKRIDVVIRKVFAP